MTDYSFITVFNNEGQQFATDRRYVATLDCQRQEVKYGCDCMPEAITASLSDNDFEDIVAYLHEQMEEVLDGLATDRKEFDDHDAYLAWLRACTFTERDVSWSVLCEFNYGQKVLFLCTDGSPAPSELDTLEEMICEALGFEEA